MSTHLGIIAALEQEAALVRRNLHITHRSVHEAGALWQGHWHGQHVVLVRCGMGVQRATAAVTRLAQQYRLWGVVCIGFAGALHQKMSTGDAVLVARVQRICQERGGISVLADETVEPDGTLAHIAELAAARAALIRHEGTLLSATTVISQTTEKQQLGQRVGAVAVDMESYSVGCVARAYCLPFLVMRTVFDTTSDELSLPAQTLTTVDGVLRPGCFVHYVLRHPSTLAVLPQLWRKARLASTNLEHWLHHFLAMLGQQSFPGRCDRR